MYSFFSSFFSSLLSFLFFLLRKAQTAHAPPSGETGFPLLVTSTRGGRRGAAELDRKRKALFLLFFFLFFFRNVLVFPVCLSLYPPPSPPPISHCRRMRSAPDATQLAQRAMASQPARQRDPCRLSWQAEGRESSTVVMEDCVSVLALHHVSACLAPVRLHQIRGSVCFHWRAESHPAFIFSLFSSLFSFSFAF